MYANREVTKPLAAFSVVRLGHLRSGSARSYIYRHVAWAEERARIVDALRTARTSDATHVARSAALRSFMASPTSTYELRSILTNPPIASS